MKEAEEKREVILKRTKEREPTTVAMTTTKAAKDVLAEKMRLLKQFEDRTRQLETKAQEAVAARIKQAEEKEKAMEREKARHEAAMAALDEEYAMAENIRRGSWKQQRRISKRFQNNIRRTFKG